MILVDMNQISLASMMMHLNMNKTTKPDEAMVRHMILNSLRMYRMKFKEELERIQGANKIYVQSGSITNLK